MYSASLHPSNHSRSLAPSPFPTLSSRINPSFVPPQTSAIRRCTTVFIYHVSATIRRVSLFIPFSPFLRKKHLFIISLPFTVRSKPSSTFRSALACSPLPRIMAPHFCAGSKERDTPFPVRGESLPRGGDEFRELSLLFCFSVFSGLWVGINRDGLRLPGSRVVLGQISLCD